MVFCIQNQIITRMIYLTKLVKNKKKKSIALVKSSEMGKFIMVATKTKLHIKQCKHLGKTYILSFNALQCHLVISNYASIISI